MRFNFKCNQYKDVFLFNNKLHHYFRNVCIKSKLQKSFTINALKSFVETYSTFITKVTKMMFKTTFTSFMISIITSTVDLVKNIETEYNF